MARKTIKKNVQDPDAFWMIRSKESGLFYTGKRWSKFRKTGKIYYSNRSIMTALRKLGPNALPLVEVVQFKRIEIAKCEAVGYGE